jgi:hypothetical protein
MVFGLKYGAPCQCSLEPMLGHSRTNGYGSSFFQIILSHAQINHHVHASLQIDLGIKPTVKRSYYVGKTFRDRILGSGCDVLKSLQSVKLRVTRDDGHEKQRI